MKKTSLAVVWCMIAGGFLAQVNSKLQPYAKEVAYNKQKQLCLIKLNETPAVAEAEVEQFINTVLFDGTTNKVSVLKAEKDELGFSHTRYSVQQNGTPVYNKTIVAHCRKGLLVSLNGDLKPYAAPVNQEILTEKKALQYALKKVNAKKYKWENRSDEMHMREVLKQPDFTYYPTGIKVLFEKEGKLYRAYQFTIYAEEPLYRAHVFVDAASGKILGEQNLICTVDVPGTAATKYSGTQTITCDQTSTAYRLRETGRGNGIETYNLNNTMNYGPPIADFTNASTSWTVINSNQGATDAHWGAESTYDYYNVTFNRNSIDNMGFKLLSYVHYSNNFNNAFWDGLRMTYGDGNGTSFTIFTALDICGHEITHGLVNNTANLGGSGADECDALNEGFADIFGTSIERFARPTNWNWIMGQDISPFGSGIRNMSNPASMGDPDTYQGTNWDFLGEPHTNAGPCIYWFYLLVNGGSGTNDIGNAYNVSGIGHVDAEKIAYRALTVYFTPNTTYADARLGAIQAAKDLFGDCSNQVQQTANAWYAVGVGPAYNSANIAPNFQSNITNFCALPATVNFNNTTSAGITYVWDFGDGSTATVTNPMHIYANNGTYTVKLKATGCLNATDSITKTAYIVVNAPGMPGTTGGSTCGTGTVQLGASGNAQLNWYASPFSTTPLGTGPNFTSPTISTTTTYYVVNTVTNAPAFGGKTAFTGGGYLNNSSQYLEFDVLQNSTLNSVVVKAQLPNPTTYVIELRDMFTNVLASTTTVLAQGNNTVTLNYILGPGTGYQLGLSSTSSSNLYRSNTGVTFPYSVGGCVDITGSSAGPNFYYWFYNWEVTKENCGSPAVAVTASVLPLPAVSLSVPANVICSGGPPVTLVGSPAGGSYSGSNVTGNTFSASAAGVGTFAVAYTYQDPNGCSASSNLSLIVSACTGLSQQSIAAAGLSIYPNPVSEKVVIKNNLGVETIAGIFDASGRLIISQRVAPGEEAIAMEGVAKGLYLLSIRDVSGNTIKTFRLVKE